MKKSFILALLFLVFILNFSSCKRVKSKSINNISKDSIDTKHEIKISKAIFFIENSESMFGYVNGLTDYVDVISELSEKPEFIESKAIREFNFINGGNSIKINKIGDNPNILKSKLNRSGFNCGDITKSNLNSMFQLALNKAAGDTISILISDAIYDSPSNALITEGKETRSKFITRLDSGDLQTLLIKLTSSFNGSYFYSSHSGFKRVNNTRPFYIWIFGKTELLNKYFTEEYISKHLKGFENYARFLNINDKNTPCQVTPSINRIGKFRPDRSMLNKINNAESDRNGNGFQFSIAVDYSSIPFSESYLETISNYFCNNQNYKIEKVEKIKSNQKYEVTSFNNPTHIITIHTNQNPCADIEISLKNETPKWISETNIDNENQVDQEHTFGFKFLTDAISEAYAYKSKGKNLANFKITISN